MLSAWVLTGGGIGAAHDPNTQPRVDDENARDPERFFGALVSMRSLQKFLTSHIVSTTTIACASLLSCFPSSSWRRVG